MSHPEIIEQIADKLAGYGYSVFLSDDHRHGFYTDGRRVVSFGGQWPYMVDFSGNYAPTRHSGTGWSIAREKIDITQEQAVAYITADAPPWTGNTAPQYTTPEQHLKTYGKSSGYTQQHQPTTQGA